MSTVVKVFRNLYRDSVSLMQISAQLAKRAGVAEAQAIMASENNLSLLREAGLLRQPVEAGPNDVLLVLSGADDAALTAGIAEAEAALSEPPPTATAGAPTQEPPRSLEMGLARMPGANLALISTPSDYAPAEAMKALRLGLSVMLFSDNVSLADELRLKRYARAHDLILMGPDCGTAIVGGVPLGFANHVRRGEIGVVGASGTGIQQVTSLIHRMGKGVSQAIGTGGHDLHREIGGISMLQGIEALAGDPATRVILLISKPPAAEIAERILSAASGAGKPVVVNFLGADPAAIERPHVLPAKTLEDAARAAVACAGGGEPPAPAPPPPAIALAPGQHFIRGLYSGGTFCFEATMLLGEVVSPVHSNTPLGTAMPLKDVWRSEAHTLLDLGDDVFTRGRPHPMIDHRLRNERILVEAADPATAVILLDVVLGTGSHPDPAAVVAPVVEEARERAREAGRQLAFVGFVCGTEGDPQDLARQEARLAAAGIVLAPSSAAAVRLAIAVAQGGNR